MRKNPWRDKKSRAAIMHGIRLAVKKRKNQPMRQKYLQHCDWIRGLPCLICGNPIETECAHIRYAEPRAGKEITGMGIKPNDCFVVPLCGHHHRDQHLFGNERRWWAAKSIDPVFAALALKAVSGDHEAGQRICAAWRDGCGANYASQ